MKGYQTMKMEVDFQEILKLSYLKMKKQKMMKEQLIRLMKTNDAPKEPYRRIGLAQICINLQKNIKISY